MIRIRTGKPVKLQPRVLRAPPPAQSQTKPVATKSHLVQSKVVKRK